VRRVFPASHARWESGTAEIEIPLKQSAADSSSP
jgi:hypothetical protein